MVVKNKILGGPKQRKKSSRTRNIPKNVPKIRKTIRPEYQKIKHMCLKFSLGDRIGKERKVEPPTPKR